MTGQAQIIFNPGYSVKKRVETVVLELKDAISSSQYCFTITIVNSFPGLQSGFTLQTQTVVAGTTLTYTILAQDPEGNTVIA